MCPKQQKTIFVSKLSFTYPIFGFFSVNFLYVGSKASNILLYRGDIKVSLIVVDENFISPKIGKLRGLKRYCW